MGNTTVSVIVPVYNAEIYLEESLSSISAQTFSDIQIIIIDDGSTDLSPEIISSYAKKDSRIIYKRTENRGPGAARNTGISMADGKYILFVDADDFIDPAFIDTMAGEADGYDICVSGKKRWNQLKNTIRTDHCRDFAGTKEELKKKLPLYYRIMRGCTGRLFSSKLIHKNDLRFHEEKMYAEDMYFDYLFFKYVSAARFLNYYGYTYRIHNKQSLARENNTFFLKQWHMQNQCIRDTFNKQRGQYP